MNPAAPSHPDPEALNLLELAIQQADKARAALVSGQAVISAEELMGRLGCSEEFFRRAVRQGRIFTVDVSGNIYYPGFYSDPELAWNDIGRVVRALDGLGGWLKWSFFTTPKGSLGGLTPLQALRRGMTTEVVTAAHGFAER